MGGRRDGGGGVVRFQSTAPRSVVLAAAVMSAPIVVLAVAAAAAKGFDGASRLVLLVMAAVGGLLIGVVSRAATIVEIDQDHVVLGLVPFRRTRLPITELSKVELINPDEEPSWAGFGIKGRERTGSGRLYSMGGRSGVRIMTNDGRQVTVAFAEPEPARTALATLRARTSGLRRFSDGA